MSDDEKMLEPIYFGNNIDIMFGDNDVHCTFGIEKPSKSGQVVFKQATIIMTPRTAKILAHNLSTIIQLYESQTGQKIDIPNMPGFEDLKTDMEKAKNKNRS